MDIVTIKNIIRERKGQNLAVTWEKQLKTLKGVSSTIIKTTNIITRGGIDYDKQKVVMEGREDGTLPEVNQGLPWGEWVEFPYHISHKGTEYARFYPSSGIDFPINVKYTIDGKEATKDEVRPLCLASEFPKRDEDERPTCFTVKAENVKEIRV